LFIDEFNYFIGATPYGLIDEDGLVEIKCPHSAADLTPEEGIEKKISCWKKVIMGPVMKLKKITSGIIKYMDS